MNFSFHFTLCMVGRNFHVRHLYIYRFNYNTGKSKYRRLKCFYYIGFGWFWKTQCILNDENYTLCYLISWHKLGIYYDQWKSIFGSLLWYVHIQFMLPWYFEQMISMFIIIRKLKTVSKGFPFLIFLGKTYTGKRNGLINLASRPAATLFKPPLNLIGIVIRNY